MCKYKTFEDFFYALLEEIKNDLQGITTDENIKGIIWYISTYNKSELVRQYSKCV